MVTKVLDNITQVSKSASKFVRVLQKSVIKILDAGAFSANVHC